MVDIVFNKVWFIPQFINQLLNTDIKSCLSNAIVCNEFGYQIVISIGFFITFLAISEFEFCIFLQPWWHFALN